MPMTPQEVYDYVESGRLDKTKLSTRGLEMYQQGERSARLSTPPTVIPAPPREVAPSKGLYTQLDEKLGGILPLGAPRLVASPPPAAAPIAPVAPAPMPIDYMPEVFRNTPGAQIQQPAVSGMAPAPATVAPPAPAPLPQTNAIKMEAAEGKTPHQGLIKILADLWQKATAQPKAGELPAPLLPGKAGEIESRVFGRAAQVVAPGGNQELPSTGNRIIDFASDIVGTGAGFAVSGGAGKAVMGAGTQGVQAIGGLLAKLPGKVVPAVTKGIAATTSGAAYGGLEASTQGATPGETAKQAAEDAAFFVAADALFSGLGALGKAASIRIRSARAGKQIAPQDVKIEYQGKTSQNYRAEGYEEFRPASGIWIKRDPKTGGEIDKRVVMETVGGIGVPRYKLWQAERQKGGPLSTQEKIDVARKFESGRLAKRKPIETPPEDFVTPQQAVKPEPMKSEVKVKPEVGVRVKSAEPVKPEVKVALEGEAAKPQPSSPPTNEDIERINRERFQKDMQDILAAQQAIPKKQPPAAPVKQGQPFSGTLYRGSGKPRSQIYSGLQKAVAGDGSYYAFNEQDAKKYGDGIETKNIQLANPLVITNDNQWKALVKESGWEFPNPVGSEDAKVVKWMDDLKKNIVSKGHDGLVVQIDPEGDMGKLLRIVFRHDQVVVYGKEGTSEVKPTETPAPQPSQQSFSVKKRIYSASDKGVTDNSQRAEISDRTITISNHFGRKLIGKYSFDLAEWEAAEKGPGANPNSNRKKLIERKFKDTFPDNYKDVLQTPLNDRIIDSEISAIKKAYEAYKKDSEIPASQPSQLAPGAIANWTDQSGESLTGEIKYINPKGVATINVQKVTAEGERSPAGKVAYVPVDKLNKGAGREQGVEAEVKPSEVAKEGKQPWEMTKNEFEDAFIFRGVVDQTMDGPNAFWGTLGVAQAYARGKDSVDSRIRIASKKTVSPEILWEDDTPVSVDDVLNRYGEIGTSIKELEIKPFQEIPKEGVDNPHRYIVKQALAEGKSVPEEVLKDYPELMDKLKEGARQEVELEQKTEQPTSKIPQKEIELEQEEPARGVTPVDEGTSISEPAKKVSTRSAGDTSEGALGKVPSENVSGTTKRGATAKSTVRSPRTDASSDGSNEPGIKEKQPATKDERLPGDGPVQPTDNADSVGDGRGDVDTAPRRRDSAASSDKPIPMATPGSNYVITGEEGIGIGGLKGKYKNNVIAIKLLKKLEIEGRIATVEEQAQLAQYVGWGGMPQAFGYGEEWAKERKELQELLSAEEYAAARASTTNAHYTSIDIIKGMYEGLQHLGFKGGRVLEPAAGVGHFLGLMPVDMVRKSKLTGIELDTITGRIAKHLYPRADIRVEGFEKTALPDGFYDLAISNVPFGDYKLHDPKYNKYGFNIHDYFFAKALDKVRPGGMVVFITSRYTMDKSNPKVRTYLAKKADLVGAIRLPNTAFKGNANTEVTTDIIVLQKRTEGVAPSDVQWTEFDHITDKNGKEIKINEYFVERPEMMLGQMELTGTMYRGGEPALIGDVEAIGEAINAAFKKMPAGVYKNEKQAKQPATAQIVLPAPGDVKPNAFAIIKGELFRREGTEMKSVQMPGPSVKRIEGMISIRDAVRKVLHTQLEDAPDAEITATQKELNKVYDAFVKANGYLSERNNASLYVNDPDAPLLLSLENYDPETKKATKADIFTKRTLLRQKKIDKVDTAQEALVVSLNEEGAINWDRMTALTGNSFETLREELRGMVFHTPSNEWNTADEYLSGDVRQKLVEAEAAGKTDSEFQENVEALKAVQPADIEPAEIDVRLGASWVPASDIKSFINYLLDVEGGIDVHHASLLGAWTVTENQKYGRNTSVANTKKWGTSRYSAIELISDSLNLKIPTVYDTNADDKRVVNQKETLAAREKQENIKEAFKKWIWEDTERRERLARKYNDAFNNIRLRTYDGSHLTTPGISSVVSLRPHQKNAIWRVIQGGNTLLAHVVGAGKTYTMVSAGMELKRMGLIKKPMYVVPNHMLEQFSGDFLRLYPSANVLIATKEDFTPAKRKELMSRIATGDWDGVVVAHSSFGKIPLSPQATNEFIEKQIDDLEATILEAQEEAGRGKTNRIIKELEKAKKRLEAKLRERLNEEGKDDTVTFEELGVDQLFVDEAHMFKNLFFATKMGRVAGIPNTDSQRAFDMFVKTQYITKANNGRGVIFATGTPISNSMAEMFTMQRYLQTGTLEAHGIGHFDSWAANFGEVVNAIELAPDGSGYRQRSRFARFTNLPELMQMFRSVADVQTGEMLKLPIPKIKGGKPATGSAEASQELKDYVATLVERAEEIRGGRVSPHVDNMLAVTNDGRKAALDMRLIDPTSEDVPYSKVNKMVANAIDLWKKTAKLKGAQLIFSDLSTPKKAGEGFSVYNDVKAKLIKGGIPAKEIAFIHDAKTDAAKQQLFNKVNNGTIRILMGSTEKMGAGMNVQQKLVALHHLDAPWRPSDIEQREGRILRQGNSNAEVEIYRYVTEGSFDAYMWQTLEAKARFIAQTMTGDITTRSADDVEGAALTYAEVKAIASGNPLVLKKVAIDTEVRKLQTLLASYNSERYSMQSELAKTPARMQDKKKWIALIQAAIAQRKDVSGDKFEITIGTKKYPERVKAGKILLGLAWKTPADMEFKKIGELAGFELMLESKDNKFTGPAKTISYVRSEDGFYLGVELGKADADPLGAIRTLENRIGNLDTFLKKDEESLADLIKKEDQLKKQLQEPFQHQDKLVKLIEEQKEINKSLDLDKSISQVETELGAEVDRVVGEIGIPMGQSVRFVGGPGPSETSKKAGQDKFGFEDPEIERRYQQAHGLTPPSFWSKIREVSETLYRRATREYEFLSRSSGEFSELRFGLNQLAKQRGVAGDRTLRIQQGITIDFSKDPVKFSLFERQVLLNDLAEEAAEGRSLPFGFNEESLANEMSRLEDEVAKRPEIQQALNKRKEAWDAIKHEYTRSMKAIGADVDKKFTKENYFRHQILEYANAKAVAGTGKKLKTPLGRGFLKQREGSTMDINTSYLQAEYEVMAQMLYDIEVAKTISRVDKHYNIQKSLEKQAKQQNQEKLTEIIEADETGLIEGAFKDFSKKIAMGFSGLRSAAKKGTLWDGDEGEFARVVEKLKEDRSPSTNDNTVFRYLAVLASKTNTPGSMEAAMIFKAISNRREFTKKVLGRHYKTWESLIPEGYSTWQPRQGNMFYMADSIPAEMAQKLYAGILEQIGLSQEQITRVLVRGQRYKEFVVKNEVALTLDNLLKDRPNDIIRDSARGLMRGWKMYILTAPQRLVKYFVRNLSGDVEAVFIGNPSAFLKVPQAVNELYPVFAGDASMSEGMRSWFYRGGMQALLQAQEMGDIDNLRMFKTMLESKGTIREIPVKVLQAWWKAARLSNDFREAILRYAAFLDYQGQMKKNNGRPNNFGASIPEEVMALSDIDDRAYKLSNDLLGAYDELTVVGQMLREYLIPFWSWNEVNTKRYYRLFKNAVRDTKSAEAAGQKILGTAVRVSPFLAIRVGRFVLRATAVTAILAIYNNLRFPDEEAELPEYVRQKAHIVLGRDEAGKPMYFAQLGILDDFLEWFGMDAPQYLVTEWLNNRMTIKEVAMHMVKSPINKLAGSIGPLFKLPAELALGRKTFPDVFAPSGIRNKVQYLAQSFSLGDEYAILVGLPHQKYSDRLREILIYQQEAGEGAYYDILDQKQAFLKKIGKYSGSFGGSTNPRTEALYNLRMAIRYEDRQAFEKFLFEYVMFGGTPNGMQTSLRNMEPLKGLDDNEKAVFVSRWLDNAGRKQLGSAYQFYNEVLLGNRPVKGASKATAAEQ